LNGNLIKNILLPWTTDFLVELSGLFMQRKNAEKKHGGTVKQLFLSLKGHCHRDFYVSG